uniref:hypothetical protein n=1 Tax=Lachnospira sp. TaxID=2049031 RepID=UPI003FF05C9A
PQKLFVVTAIPKSIIAIPDNSILIPFIANIFVTNYDLLFSFYHTEPVFYTSQFDKDNQLFLTAPVCSLFVFDRFF